MQHKLFFFISLLLVISYCQGQTDSLSQKPSRLNIFFSAGAGVPIGKFSQFQKIPGSNSSSNYNLAGEAKTGISAKVGGRYLLGKHIGIIANASVALFPAAKKSSSEIFEGFSFGSGTVSDIGTWKAGGLLIGAVYELSGKKMSYGFSLNAGGEIAWSPGTELTLNSPPPTGFTGDTYKRKLVQPVMSSITFVYGAGAFARYRMGKKASLGLHADYSSAAHNFHGKDLESEITYTYLGSVNTTKSNIPISFKKQVSFVTVLLGITFDL